MLLRQYRISVFIGFGTLIALGFASYELAGLQRGLEPPPATMLQVAEVQSASFDPPQQISEYESFDVVVTDNVSVRVHARESPDAKANILLVHGAGGGAWVWEEFFEDLPNTYNLYALSWRGHFESTPVADATSADYVKDQIAVLRSISDRSNLPTHVIGHSYGGATSVLMAAQDDVEIASLHLLAPVCSVGLLGDATRACAADSTGVHQNRE